MKIHGVDLIESGDMVCLSHRRNGYFEDESIEAWREALKGGGIALDVGSYTGLYSMVAIGAGADMAYAFEPNPVVFDRLSDNLEANGITAVLASNVAVGSRPGTVKMDNINGRPKLTSAGRVIKGGDTPMVVIDKAIPGDHNVKAMKIDVEGAEPDVIEGAAETIARCKPMMIVEVLTHDMTHKVVNLLESLGYNDFDTTKERNLIARVVSE